MTSRCRVACAGLLMAGFVVPAAAEDLAYRFSADEVLRYSVKRTMKAGPAGGAAVEHDTSTLTLDLGGGDRVVARIREWEWTQQIGNGAFAFDSAKIYGVAAVQRDPRYGVCGGMVGDAYRCAVGSRGEVEVAEFAALVARGARRGLPTSAAPTGDWTPADPDTVPTEPLACLIVPLPETAGVGAEWTGTRKTRLLSLPATLALTYRITTITGGKATITVGGTFEADTPNQGTKRTGEIQGSATFDLKAGRLLASKWRTTMTLIGITMSLSNELRLLKAVPTAEAGPASCELPLKSGATCLERRVVSGEPNTAVPIHADETLASPAFAACGGDALRVIASKEAAGKRLLKVVTARGRIGWLDAAATRSVG